MYDRYESPFSTRYASNEMQYLFSAKKFSPEMKWVALAETKWCWGCPSRKAR